jgi:hypothetical protein
LLIAAPLTSLTKEKVDTVAGLKAAECLMAFNFLKEKFESAPLLMHFDFFKPRVLHVNISKYALSAVLSQHDDSGAL